MEIEHWCAYFFPYYRDSSKWTGASSSRLNDDTQLCTPHSVGLLWTSTSQQSTIETSVSPAGFEPTFPASEFPQTHALDLAGATNGCVAVAWSLLPMRVGTVGSPVSMDVKLDLL
jgi:hypothetical protein